MNVLAERIIDLAQIADACRDGMTAVCLKVRENEERGNSSYHV